VPEPRIPYPHGAMPPYVARLSGDGPWPGVTVIHSALGMSRDLRNQVDCTAVNSRRMADSGETGVPIGWSVTDGRGWPMSSCAE